MEPFYYGGSDPNRGTHPKRLCDDAKNDQVKNDMARGKSLAVADTNDDASNKQKLTKQPKTQVKPQAVPSKQESDSDDDDYYTNILQKKGKKAVALKKQPVEEHKIVLSDNDLWKDEDLLGDSTEEELPVSERIKQHVEELKKKEKAETEKAMGSIRDRAMKSHHDVPGSNVYVNPDVDKARRDLRYIRKVESRMDDSPTERIRTKLSSKTQKSLVEKVALTIDDLEHPGSVQIKYDWPMDETFAGLKEKIAKKWDVDAACVRIELAAEAKKICDGHTPRNIGLEPYECAHFTAIILGKRIPRAQPAEKKKHRNVQ